MQDNRSWRKRQKQRQRAAVFAGGSLLLLGLCAGIGWLAGTRLKPSVHDPVPSVKPLPPVIPVTDTNTQTQTPPSNTLLTMGTQAVPIIMYHDVVPRKQVYFDLTTYEFRQQMNALESAGAHPVGMQDVYDHFKSGKPLPNRAILLTFDDCTLGQFTDALPILKAHKFPAVFFVQTASVGVKTEKEHMTWDQLREAEKTGLITVQSHTVTHPEDITQVSDDALKNEMEQSKQTLESELGHSIPFLAYPSGHCDARVEAAAESAGYLAAVTMDRGWAASPAQSFFLPRFTPKRVQEVMDAWQGNGPTEPPLPRLVDIKNTPLEMGAFKGQTANVQWVAGGDLGSQALDTRKTVGEMAHDANVQAALNGTFFIDAKVESTGSGMVGPVLSREGNVYKPNSPELDPIIEGRPLIMIGDAKCLIVPYTPHLGYSQAVLQGILPDIKDAFLAGGWIVHNGKALPSDMMAKWSTGDAKDPRHRAFVGIDSQHRYVLGATQDSVSTSRLAQTLETMKIEEAWLLDSGFSTSLIWQNHVLVSGHSRKETPSRPVPHALFLYGEVASGATPPPPDSAIASGAGAASTQDALQADAGGHPTHSRRRRRRRRHSDTPSSSASTSAAPSAPAAATGQ